MVVSWMCLYVLFGLALTLVPFVLVVMVALFMVPLFLHFLQVPKFLSSDLRFRFRFRV